MKTKLLLLLILLVSFASFSQSTEQQVRQKIDELNELIDIAEDKDIDATRERMGVRVAKIALIGADWDENNVGHNEAEYSSLKPIPSTTNPKPSARQLAERVPEFQREEALKVLKEDIDKLTKLIDGDVTRKATPKILWNQLKVEGSRITQNGKPIFLNDWNFKGGSVGGNSLREYFGDMDGIYVALNNVKRGNNNTIVANQGIIDKINNSGSGTIGAPFLGENEIAGFIKNDYPDIQDGRSEFTGFDIDHPVAREMHAALFKGIVPAFKGKVQNRLGYMLTNEPHWNTVGTWSIVDISARTKAKFADWLKNKHNNSLNDMNSLWGSSHSSFQNAANSIQTPIPSNLRGNPKWFDFLRFNQNRVTNWFKFLVDEIKKHDPDAKTHIKLISGQFSGSSRHHGLDFEMLTYITDIHGNDADMKNSVLWGNNDWQDKYTVEWFNAVLIYDFMHSIRPNSINYNSEGHFLTTSGFADMFLEPSYATATRWLSTMHGLDANRSWVWLRDNDGSIKDPQFKHGGTVAQQPGVLNAVYKSLMDINSYAEEVSLLQELKAPIRLFYSETSAIIQGDFMKGIKSTFESLYFEGYRLGFASKNILNTQNNSDLEVIVVRKVKNVTVSELNALQGYLDNGGTVILDNESLKKDEYGRDHSISLNQSAGSLINTSNFKDAALKVVQDKGFKPLIEVDEDNSASGNFKGVTHRSIKTPDGRNIIYLLNLGITDARITLNLNNSEDLKIKDLLNGIDLTNGFNIPTEGVLFLEVEGSSLSVDDNISSLKDLIKVYPNPFTNEFFVNSSSEKKLQYKIYNINGSILQEGNMNGQNQRFTLQDLSSGVYFIALYEGKNRSITKLIRK